MTETTTIASGIGERLGHARLKGSRQRKSKWDDGPIWNPPQLPRVQPGERELLCVSAKRIKAFGQERADLIFIDPLNPEVKFHHYLLLKFKTHSAQYYLDWTVANGSPPARNQRMSLNVFENKIFRVRIDWTLKDFKGRDLVAGEGYSCVKQIIARTQ